MALWKRGKRGIYWARFQYGGKNYLKSTGTTDPKQAAIFERDLRNKIALNQTPDLKPKKIPVLSQAINQTYEERWQYNKDGAKSKRRAIMVQTIIGDLPINNIDRSSIHKVITYFKATGRSHALTNRHLEVLSVILHLARDQWEVLNRIPKIELLKTPPGRIKVLSIEEEESLIQGFIELGYPHFADLVQILIDTGMREGNAIRLEWRDVNFKVGLISLWVNKADKPYSIPMTARIKRILMNRKLAGHLRPFPYGQSTFKHVFTRVREKIGMRDDHQMVAYALRHTACTRLIAAGMDIKRVKEFMGHKIISTTEKYTHLNPEHLRELAAILDKFDTTFDTALPQK